MLWWTGWTRLLLAECKSQNTKDNKQSNNHCVVITIGVDSKNRYYYNGAQWVGAGTMARSDLQPLERHGGGCDDREEGRLILITP